MTRTRLFLEVIGQILPKVGSVVVVQDDQVGPLPLLQLREGQPRAEP